MEGNIDAPVRERLHQEVVGEGAQHRPCIRVRWAVLATQPQGEHWAEQNLRQRGYQPYLPLFASMQRDKVVRSFKHLVLRPLFPTYLFAAVDEHSWFPIRRMPGVRTVLMNGYAQPHWLPHGTVEAIQASDALRMLPTTQSHVQPGSAVTLTDGPFHGLNAVVLSVGTDMALVSLMMLGQLRNVAVALSCLMAREEH